MGELDRDMSYSEFLYWQAFSVLEPIGIMREDALFANVSKTIADVKFPDHGLELDSFMVFKPRIERTVQDVCDDIKFRMSSFM